MWHIFGHKEEEEGQEESLEKSLDVEILNENCYECDFCKAIHSLHEAPPLSIAKCNECGASNFIPYLIKNYWLYRPLGGGGMGSVYKAVHCSDPTLKFAVKVLPREKKDDPILIEALMNEAKIGYSFGRHPHLIAVTDYGKYQDEYFVALEFTTGMRLDQVIDSPDNINQKYILLWALQLLSAEQHMWDCGYLYRDMKPQNIMIEPSKNVKLYDYGLCIAKDDRSAQESDVVQGSPLYMPPERIVGMEENMTSEIYSIGMVIFHALARKTYYTASGAFELAKKHVTSLRTSSVASKLPSSVNPLIAPVLDKMLAKIPKDRFQSFKESALAIKEIYSKI